MTDTLEVFEKFGKPFLPGCVNSLGTGGVEPGALPLSLQDAMPGCSAELAAWGRTSATQLMVVAGSTLDVGTTSQWLCPDDGFSFCVSFGMLYLFFFSLPIVRRLD